MGEGLPRAVAITEVVRETPRIRTFRLSESFSFTPGQFVMVWVPGVDEIPMALSGGNSISVQEVGDATSAMFRLGKGDLLGIRGPFGEGFSVNGRVLAIAGGIGAAPLLPLAMAGKVGAFLLGAATGRELPFRKLLAGKTDLRVATDDGSDGHRGPVTALLGDLDLRSFDHICTCGPEPMMRAVVALLGKEQILDRGQFSLHRYMKCGVGLCGSCVIDPSGLRVCRDGPVFRGDQLAGSEFGKYGRDASGRRHPVP
ncbi:MAG TPA: dihydroorotate dehydrogenase electron transfer subunit [Methanomicrobiales archaeon]|nr:dihydroorotate dehydrogenase electron transfer subunit [Methanomicrobiales archaeon]